MSLINYEVNLILTQPSTCVITNSSGGGRFAINITKLSVSVVTLSTPNNAKFLLQLKSGFKRKINWNKSQNRYSNHLIDSFFEWVNRLFVLSFENEDNRTSHSEYYLPKVEIKTYNIMIDGKNVFDQPIKNNFKTYENIRKIATGIGGDYTNGCLLDYTYFREN